MASHSKFFATEKIPEMLSLINSGPNLYRKVTSSRYIPIAENATLLIPTKISNLTQDFGVLVDNAGETSSNRFRPLESTVHWKGVHWKYCTWKMQHLVNENKLSKAFANNIFDCDGKCILPDWDENFELYIKQSREINMCFWRAENRIRSDVNNLDAAKIELCRGFKTLVENCSVPIYECIEDIAIREFVMAEFLKDMVTRTKRVIKIVENFIPNFYGSFTYDDCVIFGGEVAGTSSISASFLFIIVTTSTLYFVL